VSLAKSPPPPRQLHLRTKNANLPVGQVVRDGRHGLRDRESSGPTAVRGKPQPKPYSAS